VGLHATPNIPQRTPRRQTRQPAIDDAGDKADSVYPHEVSRSTSAYIDQEEFAKNSPIRTAGVLSSLNLNRIQNRKLPLKT